MEELLQRLETKIRDLIDKHDHLADSNTQLNQGKASLSREKDALLHKQQKAITQIEGLVARLKSIGKMP
jgi:uncharacterized protein (TIGR02449 family)